MARLAKQFDERQLRIRGQIFFHGFLVALALLLINAFLQDNAIVWANAFDQNIMIIMVTVMTVSIEAILRGAFFGRRQNHWPMIIVYGACAALIIVFYSVSLAQGSTFAEHATLSNSGANLLIGLMAGIAAIIGIIREVYDRRANAE